MLGSQDQIISPVELYQSICRRLPFHHSIDGHLDFSYLSIESLVMQGGHQVRTSIGSQRRSPPLALTTKRFALITMAVPESSAMWCVAERYLSSKDRSLGHPHSGMSHSSLGQERRE